MLRLICINNLTTIDGSRVYDFFPDDRHKEITGYCACEMLLIRTLYRRMNFINNESQQAA